jgi:hypothetical protein
MKLADWLGAQSRADRVWLLKRLSANDVGATDSHQVGIYLSKPATKVLFHGLLDAGNGPDNTNPKRDCTAHLESHGYKGSPVCTWYNQKTRDEVRLTRWGGKSCPLQQDEQVGALLVLTFPQHAFGTRQLEGWLARNPEEEEQIETLVGEVMPGEGRLYFPSGELPMPPSTECDLAEHELPPAWLTKFPSAEDLVQFALERRPARGRTPDERLLIRRACEEQLFYSVERIALLPRVRAGFPTVPDFISYALSVLNRRKSRSGRSLELHLKAIFKEQGVSFSHNEVTEDGKTPDFVFPSIDAYRDPHFPTSKLRMLAVKTTLKDRWRQVITEASRLRDAPKHLLTLQEGISATQHEEMRAENVRLVVPRALHGKYIKDIREQLVSLEDFCL